MAPLRTLLLGSDALRGQLREELSEPRLSSLVGEAKSLPDGVDLAASTQPDLVVVAFGGDLAATMRGIDGLHAACPTATVLLVGAKLDSDALGLAMRAGIREVVGSSAELRSAIQRTQVFLSRVRGARSEPERVRSGKTIVVYSPKGGSGRSTLAVNLAIALATDRPGGAALVELAPQFSELDLLLNLKPPAHLSDVARLGPHPDEESIDQALSSHSSGLKVLSSTPSPEDGELIDGAVVGAVLKHLQRRVDLTVVDASSLVNEATVRALEIAHRIVVPMFPDLASLRHVQRGFRILQELGLPLDQVDVVTWAQKSEVDEAAIQRILHRSIARRLPYVPEEALAAINAGSPMVLLSPQSAFSKALKSYSRCFAEPAQTALVEAKSPANRLAELWNRLRRMIDVPAQPT